MILQKLLFYPDLVLKNVLSISYQSYRPQLYNGSVNDPASRYHVCLQDCSVSECVCVHFAGSWTTLYRLVYIYICLCVNISGHACGLVFVCTSMWMCVGEMWVCVCECRTVGWFWGEALLEEESGTLAPWGALGKNLRSNGEHSLRCSAPLPCNRPRLGPGC